MKKIMIGLLVFIFLLPTIAVPAFAASTTYNLDELGLTVTIPSKYDVITQETPPYSSVFSDRGISGTDILDQFKAGGIYLNAIPNDGTNEEIVVTMTDGLWENLSIFSDTTIKALATSLVSGYKDHGIDILEYDIYQHSQAKFIRIYFTDAEKSVYGLQYYTNYDAKAMNFTMRSYSGELSQAQEDTIKAVVDSIKYDNPPVSAPVVPETEAFVYTDTETNTKFTVPANWHEEELSKVREFIDVKFASGKEEGLTIMYGSTDLWEMLTPEEKFGLSRSDINNSVFTSEEIALFLGADESKISKVTYNGVEYYQVAVETTTEMYGTEFTVEMTYIVRIDNGWGYWFQFSGTTDSAYFADFESLLDSVQYAHGGNADSLNPEVVSKMEDPESSKLPAIIIVVLSLGFAVVLFLCIRKSKRKKEASLNADLSSALEGTAKCPDCGSSLAQDSLFCHICGAKITIGSDPKGEQEF